MPWKYWILVSGVVSLLVSMWVSSGVQTTMIDRQNTAIHTALDEVEKDMGTYNPDSARALTAPARAMKVARKQAQLAEAKQAEMRAMVERIEHPEMGADSDSTSTSTEIRYDEYGRPIDNSAPPQHYFDEYGRPIH